MHICAGSDDKPEPSMAVPANAGSADSDILANGVLFKKATAHATYSFPCSPWLHAPFSVRGEWSSAGAKDNKSAKPTGRNDPRHLKTGTNFLCRKKIPGESSCVVMNKTFNVRHGKMISPSGNLHDLCRVSYEDNTTAALSSASACVWRCLV
jgi:hypothetical protein